MRFSVLIPVYNVEKYLRQCLTSVLSQDFTDYEVILVNDGSTDQSPAICQEMAARDNRIKYFDKQNEGLLLTRRFSIKHAAGEYIVFLDSDDFWEPGVLSRLNKEIESCHADMICYRYRIITDDGKFVSNDVGVFPDRSFFDENNKETFLEAFVGSSRLNVLWSKCVKYSIIDKDFDYSPFGDKKGEDLLQSIALIRNAHTILYMDEVFVNYRLSSTGRGRNYKLKYLDDFEVVKHHIYDNLMEMQVSDIIFSLFFRRYMESLVDFLGLVVASVKNYESFKKTCMHVREFYVYKKFGEKMNPDEMKLSCRFDYHNLQNSHFFRTYVFHKTKNKLIRIRDKALG